jgi:ubiquinone/menaquinone biosynthesis C-methylase UbiE
MAESRFDQAAATWDENPGRIAMARAIVAAILAQVPVRAEMTAVDFGCGTGLVSLGLAERVRRVIGIDSSAGMLNVLNEKLRKAGIRNVETLLLDLETAPAPDLHADMIASAMTLHHLLDVPAVLGKLASMLAPGGYLALADLVTEDGSFHGDMTGVRHLGFDPGWVAEVQCGLGFEDLHSSIAYVIDRGEKRYPVFLVSGRKKI